MKKLLSITILLLVGGVAFADDLNPPSWRGLPGSTLTQWEFLTDSATPTPEIQVNPFGSARIMVYPTHPWQLYWGGRQGVWALSGLMDIEIDNSPVLNPVKYIQIQLTWAGEFNSPAAVPTIDVKGGLPTGVVDGVEISRNTVNLEPTGVTGVDPFWHHTTYLFEITPNPFIDFIDIGGSVWVDELVIDTICIPEPATLAFLGLGSLGGVLLRKRK